MSFTDGGLRIHRGYAYASDRALQAVLSLVRPYTRGTNRKKAELEVTSFPVDHFVVSQHARHSRERMKPSGRPVLARLKELHERLNTAHFGGRLTPIRFRISGRWITRLGELIVDSSTNKAMEMGMSRRHLACDDWSEVAHTVLHEMVHQWQVAQGLQINHGATFRTKAGEVGILPRAIRNVRAIRRAARHHWNRGT